MTSASPEGPLLALDHVGKDYAKVESRGGRLRLVWDLLRGHGAAHVFRALDDVSFAMRPRRIAGRHRRERRGQVDAAQDRRRRDPADARHRRRQRARRRVARARLRLSSRTTRGYANIDLAAALLGLGPDEIEAKREEIIAFADIGEHIHDPIKHYSSGMVVRLGFAVATALRPHILITDEVLAVGDESFQKKCVAWMEDYLRDGGTLLLCSHSMYHVQKLCRHALWLRGGRVERYGPAMDVTQAYLAFHEEKSAKAKEPIASAVAASAGVYALQSLELAPGDTLAQGAALTVRGEVYSPDGRAPVVLVGIVRADGTPVYGVATDMEDVSPARIADDRFRFTLVLPELPLLPGKYFVRAHALDPEGVRLFDHVERPLVITGQSREMGFVRLAHRWQNDP